MQQTTLDFGHQKWREGRETEGVPASSEGAEMN